MGLLTSLVGMPVSVEPWVWILIYAIWIAVLVHRRHPAPIRTATAASLLAGALAGTAQTLLFGTYRANNPWSADQIAGLDATSAAPGVIGTGLAAGLIFGLVTGAVARVIIRRRFCSAL